MKKGFTLIELLAVVVILSIVALIATPMILDAVKESKESAIASEVQLVLSGINNYCANESISYTNDNLCLDGVTKEEVSTMVQLQGLVIEQLNYSDTIDLLIASRGDYLAIYEANKKVEVISKNSDKSLIIYDLAGGTSDVNYQIKNASSVTLSSVKPKKAGYKFLGWGTSDTDDTVTYNLGDTYAGDSIRLYAKWRPLICNVVLGNGDKIGDIIKCDTEEFYVMKVDSNYTYMLSKNSLDINTFLQSETPTSQINNLENYTAYKNKLISLGIDVSEVKNVVTQDLTNIGCYGFTTATNTGYCSGAPAWVYDKVYFGPTSSGNRVYVVTASSFTDYSQSSASYPMRPEVVIPTEEININKINTITYNLAGGSSSILSENALSNIPKKITTVEPTLENYIFRGWSYKGKTYLPGEEITVLKDVVLNAIWTKEEHCTVAYGDGTTLGDIIKCGTEEFYVLKNNGITTEMFAKYNLDSSYKQSSNNSVTLPYADEDLYYNNYKKILKNMGYVMSTVSAPNISSYANNLGCTYQYSSSYCPSNFATTTKYWTSGGRMNGTLLYTNKSSDNIYGARPGVTIENSRINYPEEVTLTYDLKGGTGSIENGRFFKNTPKKITTAVPVRTNYIFRGWDYKGIKYLPGSEITLPNNATLTAIWVPEIMCSIQTGDGATLGDVIKCGTEEFYVLKNNGTTTEMFAKYNLDSSYKQSSDNSVTLRYEDEDLYYNNYSDYLKDIGVAIDRVSAPNISSYANNLGCTYQYSSSYCPSNFATTTKYWTSGGRMNGTLLYTNKSSDNIYGARPGVTIDNSRINYPEEVTLTYDLKGGTGSIENGRFFKNIPKKITTAVPVRTNYIFRGWDYKGIKYLPGSEITLPNNATLTAIWVPEIMCSIQTGDGATLGDVIKCGTEEFYVLKNNGTTTEMFAKYNLDSSYKQSSDNSVTLRYEDENLYYNNYNEYLKDIGVAANSVSAPNISSYANNLGCTYQYSSSYCPSNFATTTKYWTSGGRMNGTLLYTNKSSDNIYGARPMIIINNNKIQ